MNLVIAFFALLGVVVGASIVNYVQTRKQRKAIGIVGAEYRKLTKYRKGKDDA